MLCFGVKFKLIQIEQIANATNCKVKLSRFVDLRYVLFILLIMRVGEVYIVRS